MITILDYNMGNLGSIFNMFKKIGFESIITNDKEKIRQASKIILPGVGSFNHAMKNLKKTNLIPLLNKKVIEDKTPILGICLGMQILAKDSEEGTIPGLGWIDAHVKKFAPSELPIPHMGWNYINIAKDHPLVNNMNKESRFYFVHSYYLSCNNISDIITETDYGARFTSSIAHKNIYGVQFHPEKSHRHGMQLLKNFAEMR